MAKRIIVCDMGPLIALAWVDVLHILPLLFPEVIIPQSVLVEVAAAISFFGFNSGAALATVVGVLIEVTLMLLVVRAVNASKGWCDAR